MKPALTHPFLENGSPSPLPRIAQNTPSFPIAPQLPPQNAPASALPQYKQGPHIIAGPQPEYAPASLLPQYKSALHQPSVTTLPSASIPRFNQPLPQHTPLQPEYAPASSLPQYQQEQPPTPHSQQVSIFYRKYTEGSKKHILAEWARSRNEMTERKFAQEVGVPRSTLQSW
jgi:hypothetical protein